MGAQIENGLRSVFPSIDPQAVVNMIPPNLTVKSIQLIVMTGHRIPGL
jgi:hypothetical protein